MIEVSVPLSKNNSLHIVKMDSGFASELDCQHQQQSAVGEGAQREGLRPLAYTGINWGYPAAAFLGLSVKTKVAEMP